MNPYLSAAYNWIPAWGQNLALTGYSALLDRERYGGRFAEFRTLLTKSEQWTATELRAYQDERLRLVVQHAYDTVPYYRRRFDEIGLRPSDVTTTGDLPKVPLLTRHDIRTNFAALRSTSVAKGAMHTGHTSGTTGTPLTVGYDRDTIWMTYAVLDRQFRWAGAKLARGGDRIAVARGNVIVPLTQTTPPFWRTNHWHNQLLLSSFHLSKSTMAVYFEELERFRPAVVDGYPSTLYLLAKYLQAQGRTFPVRAATTSSETLYDFQRAAIEERFCCKVFDYYGMAERVTFSGECPEHHRHHLAMEYGVTEVTDRSGMPVADGEAGTLVGTTLHNLAMPLIRYVSNDATAIEPGECGCGRKLAMMAEVTTKAEDVLTLKDGRLISPSVLTHPFKPLDCIEGSQIVQTAPDRVIIRIVPGPDYDHALTAHLKREFTARLGEDVHIDVEMVDHLESAKNGKFKWVISNVPLGI